MYKKEHLRVLVWVIALSFGFYGIKVGLAGVLSLGRVQVLQGPGGMLEDNLRRTLLIYDSGLGFLWERPQSLVIALLCVGALCVPLALLALPSLLVPLSPLPRRALPSPPRVACTPRRRRERVSCRPRVIGQAFLLSALSSSLGSPLRRCSAESLPRKRTRGGIKG